MDLTEVAVFSNPARTHQGQNRTLARTGHRINQVQVLCVRPEDEVGVTEMEKGHFASSGNSLTRFTFLTMLVNLRVAIWLRVSDWASSRG